MVHIGVMQSTHYLIDALYEASMRVFGETDAIAEAQWYPLDKIAQDYRNKKIKRRTAEALFRKALEGADMFPLDDFPLTLDDAVDHSSQYEEFRDSFAELTCQEYREHDNWVVYTDAPKALISGSYDPFDTVDLSEVGECNFVAIEVGNLIYFLRSDNIVDGCENRFIEVSIAGKNYPVFDIDLVNRDCCVGPTYGPPHEAIMRMSEEILSEAGKTGKTVEQLLSEAAGW